MSAIQLPFRRALPTLAVAGAHLLGLAVVLAAVQAPSAKPQVEQVMRAALFAPKPMPVEAPQHKAEPKPQPAPLPQARPEPMPLLTSAPPTSNAITAPPPAPVQPEPPKAATPVASAAPLPVSMPRSDAVGLHNPKPPYPATSRKLQEEGTVQVDVHVLADGSVDQVKLKQSSGFDRLDQSALDTLKHWKFVPARQGDTPLAMWYVVPVAFSINA